MEDFGSIEYAVICVMLVLSLLIGVYFTFCSRQDSYDEYIFGGRNMAILPVAMSQVASNISGLALVGTPVEVYSYGTLYSLALLVDIIVPFINIYFFLPVLYNLQLNSLFEYLEMRFNRNTKILGSLIFTISQIVYFPAIVYVPALVFNQVSGLSVPFAATMITTICIIYTSFGGLKAVLWTDCLQNFFSLAAMLFILWLGVKQAGGFSNIIDIAEEGNRLEFLHLDPSPTSRNSFWAITIGIMGSWIVMLAVHPGALQRSLALPSLEKAKKALIWTAFGVFLIHVIVTVMGLVLYARYHGCDPIATGEIKKSGQMLPLFVTVVSKGFPGLSGLFVSGIFSAALSSISSSINTMSGTIYEDLIEEFILKNKNTSEEKKTLVMKTVAVLVGVVGTLLVLLINKTESIFEMSFALPGITNGAILTLFVAGLFIPRVNSKGVLAGAGTSLIVMAWLLLNTQYFIISKNLRYPAKFTRVDQCPGNYSTDPKVLSRLETWRGYSSPTVADDNVPYVYQISYMYYTPLGFMIGTIVAILVSMLTKPPTQRNLDLKLISPYVHKFLPSQRKNVEMTELSSVIGNKKMEDNNEKLLVKEQQNDED